MCGLFDEPTLDQLLAEPIVQQLMRSDRAGEESIRRLLQQAGTAPISLGSTSTSGMPERCLMDHNSTIPAAQALSFLHPRGAGLFLSLAAVAVAVVPVIWCAWHADQSGRWDLFERAGSITTTIGLAFASRRYIRHSALELVESSEEKGATDLAETLDGIFDEKLGFALSAYGTLVWGWGSYIRWWSFGYLAIWALLTALRFRRDYRRVKGARGAWLQLPSGPSKAKL